GRLRANVDTVKIEGIDLKPRADERYIASTGGACHHHPRRTGGRARNGPESGWRYYPRPRERSIVSCFRRGTESIHAPRKRGGRFGKRLPEDHSGTDHYDWNGAGGNVDYLGNGGIWCRSGSFVGEPSGPVLAPSTGLQRVINYFQGHLVLPVSDGFSFVLSQAETENAVGSQTVVLSTAPIWNYGSTSQVTNGMAPLINSATPRVRTAIPSYGVVLSRAK
ncbi:hypothetical protein L917_06628, partial [Phytophthora nicotianae]